MELPSGATNGIAGGLTMGAKLIPLFLGMILPFAIKATASFEGNS
jgi:hypothetical protein